MSLLRQTWILARNDLRQELRNFEVLVTAGFFTVVILALYAVGYAALSEEVHPKVVPGMLWIGVAFTGVLTLTRVFDREREADTLRALLAAPVERLAIYLSKLLVTVVVLALCAALLVPGLVYLFPGADMLLARPGATLALVVAGCLGYAAVGTLFSAGLATSSGKNVLLSLILYPLTTPVLLLALVATQRLMTGHPGATSTIGQLYLVDAALLALGGLLFETVLVGARAPGGAPDAQRARHARMGGAASAEGHPSRAGERRRS